MILALLHCYWKPQLPTLFQSQFIHKPLLALEEVLRILWACRTAQGAGTILIFQVLGLGLAIATTLQIYSVNALTGQSNTFFLCFLGATFDPFGAPSKPSGQDLLGSFLNTSSASSDPFLQPTRSPSPTVHGKKVFYIVFSRTQISTRYQ